MADMPIDSLRCVNVLISTADAESDVLWWKWAMWCLKQLTFMEMKIVHCMKPVIDRFVHNGEVWTEETTQAALSHACSTTQGMLNVLDAVSIQGYLMFDTAEFHFRKIKAFMVTRTELITPDFS